MCEVPRYRELSIDTTPLGCADRERKQKATLAPTNQSTSQPANQPTNQPNNQPTNQQSMASPSVRWFFIGDVLLHNTTLIYSSWYLRYYPTNNQSSFNFHIMCARWPSTLGSTRSQLSSFDECNSFVKWGRCCTAILAKTSSPTKNFAKPRIFRTPNTLLHAIKWSPRDLLCCVDYEKNVLSLLLLAYAN